MSTNADPQPTILVVDDEPDVADTQALRLSAKYETRAAYGGAEALEAAGPATDGILLDRRMPGVHGDKVLSRLRSRGYDGVVIMLTAVDPDLNILEMEFDDYLQKPVNQDTLISAFDQHLDVQARDEVLMEEFFTITSKMEVLEAEKTETQLQNSAEYSALSERAEELRAELQQEMDDFRELYEAHKSLSRSGSLV